MIHVRIWGKGHASAWIVGLRQMLVPTNPGCTPCTIRCRYSSLRLRRSCSSIVQFMNRSLELQLLAGKKERKRCRKKRERAA